MENDFIEIDSKNFQLSDIKSYEITTEEIQQQWIEKKKPNLLVRIILFFVGATAEDREIVKSGMRAYDVLIIRNTQGNEFRFSKNDYVFDIQEKARELNEYLNSK